MARRLGLRASDRELLRRLGPGLITGAADDDPSGIATYSQAGAQFGYGLLWTALFTFPLMVAIQVVSARIGRVTGHGIAENISRYYPPWLLFLAVGLLVVANTINLAADIAAMGQAVHLVAGGPEQVWSVLFGAFSLVLQLFVPYSRYTTYLKWLTLGLLLYVATAFVVHVSWGEVIWQTLTPRLSLKPDYLLAIAAVLGTTISPYLFFWQASMEVEDLHAVHEEEPLHQAPHRAPVHLARIHLDTVVGMGFSNLVAFFIMLTAAATLGVHGVTDIQTAAQAAQALRPIAGEFAFLAFSAGIIGTGLLAIPVLAGSAAYAVAEAFKWRIGLARKPLEARGFYGIIVAATVIGIMLDFTPINPMKALFWSAVINCIIAVPIMALMMAMASQRRVMGEFAIGWGLRLVGWVATALMAAVLVALLLTV